MKRIIQFPALKRLVSRYSISHLSKSQVEFFNTNGYLILPEFMSDSDSSKLRNRIGEIAKTFDRKTVKYSIFTATGTDDAKHSKDDYFYDSADKISFFLEEDAVDQATGELKYPVESSLNKIGHALHDKDETFKKFSFQGKIHDYCVDLGMKLPSLVQSMYIFKSPLHGGAVTPHQDSTYLYTESDTAVVCGMWFALEDANKSNGCLWGLPGSHKKGLQTRWERTSDGPKFLPVKPELGYDTDRYDKGYVPLEVPKNSCIMLHGHFVHRSFKNVSDKPRDAYALHIVDGADKWSKGNWIQRDDKFPQYWTKQ